MVAFLGSKKYCFVEKRLWSSISRPVAVTSLTQAYFVLIVITSQWQGKLLLELLAIVEIEVQRVRFRKQAVLLNQVFCLRNNVPLLFEGK